MNIAWWLEHAKHEHGPKTAVIDDDGAVLSYTELAELSASAAALLRKRYGVEEGDVVATLAGDSGAHMALMYGVIRIGAVLTAFNPRLRADRLAADLAKCGAVVLVAEGRYHALAKQIVADAPHCRIWIVGGPGSAAAEFRAAISGAPALPGIVARASSDVAAINFTAGSTGAAKGVIFTHGTLNTSAQGAVFTSQITSTAINLSLIGLYHSGGLHDAVKFVLAGATIVWSNGWDVERVVRLLTLYRPNWIFFIVPTMVRDLMSHAAWSDLDLDGVGMYVAGEPVPIDIANALDAKNSRYFNAYGMTETMPFRITGPSQEGIDTPPGSSGIPNREFCAVMLKEPDGRQVTKPYVQGEVCVRGDIVSPGYIADSKRTAEAFDDDGFLHTKDLAYFDEDGWFYLCGRTDDVINCGGEKLSLSEVDDLLLKSGLIADVACAGVAHGRFGEVPAAFIVKRDSTDDQELASRLDEYMTGAAERWKRPRLYAFVDAIPRVLAKGTKARHELKAKLTDVVVPANEQIVLLDVRQAPVPNNPHQKNQEEL